MDDIAWERSLALRRQRIQRQRRYFFLFLFAAIAIAVGVWHHFFYTRTPEYALKEVQTAIEERDKEKFARYVNLELVTNQAYDDLTRDLFAYDSTLTPQTRVLFEKFYVLVKPELTRGTQEAILRRIESGLWTLPDGLDILKGRQLGIDFERFLERSQIRNIEYINVESAHVVGDTADVQVSIRDRVTEIPFSLRLRMERAQDGHWQVIRMENYKLYLDALATRQNQDIADYIAATYDIVSSYNQMLESQRARFSALARQAHGVFYGDTADAVAALIENETIPTLKERQNQLDAIAIPRGAAYLANMRHTSTDLSIAAWTHYLKGITTGENEEYNTAETLLKQELEIELRITDIIQHNTVSQALPDIP